MVCDPGGGSDSEGGCLYSGRAVHGVSGGG